MRRFFILSALVCGLAAPGALGDDIQIPWWRGQVSTTSQIWEFMEPTNPAPPDGPAPGGMPPLPSTQVTITPGPGMQFMPDDPFSSRLGIWPLSGRMDVIVDNHDPKPENEKWIWVQVTWRPQDPGEVPIFENLVPEPPNPPQLIERFQLPEGWFEDTYFWKLPFNPPDEMFTITGTIDVDELVIDTWCVIPEPATLSLLGLAALPLLRRRRR